MTYYGDELMHYWINGIVVALTEEQAEHYQSHSIARETCAQVDEDGNDLPQEETNDGLETATQADYDRQCEQIVDAEIDPWYIEWTVLWVNNEPVLVQDDEIATFMAEHADDEVTDEYVMPRDETSDTIECKCTDSHTCDDCYDFFQSLLDD